MESAVAHALAARESRNTDRLTAFVAPGEGWARISHAVDDAYPHYWMPGCAGITGHLSPVTAAATPSRISRALRSAGFRRRSIRTPAHETCEARPMQWR